MSLQFNQVKETCIYMKNLSLAKEFYHEKLGLPIIAEDEDRHIFFRVGDSLFMCFNPNATQMAAKLPPHHAQGQIHYAFEVPEKQYDKWKEKLRNESVPIEQEVEWNGKKSFYFRDPVQNLGEIVMEGMWGF